MISHWWEVNDQQDLRKENVCTHTHLCTRLYQTLIVTVVFVFISKQSAGVSLSQANKETNFRKTMSFVPTQTFQSSIVQLYTDCKADMEIDSDHYRQSLVFCGELNFHIDPSSSQYTTDVVRLRRFSTPTSAAIREICCLNSLSRSNETEIIYLTISFFFHCK